MTDKLTALQKMEQAMRRRYGQNGSANDDVELSQDINPFTRPGWLRFTEEMPIEEARRRYPYARPVPEPAGLRVGYLICDCICNCGSIVQVARTPRKGTSDTLCMSCLEQHNRLNPEHMPWPISGVVVLPPEKK